MIIPKDDFKECERCFMDVHINAMSVKQTPDGVCIYCPKCIHYIKHLDNELIRLCNIYNITINNKKK